MKDYSQRQIRLILAGFLLSGGAALIYEVTWTRALSLVLGSTVYALSTMLATFMAGLAIGAHLGGKIADRSDNPLFWFGLAELGIAVGGLVSLPLIHALPATYLWLYRSFHLAPSLFFVGQVVLCSMVMLVPTLLMGATFPLVARAVTKDLTELGRKVGEAYTFNTVGAVMGSLLVGFVLIPRLGVKGATAVAAGLNVLIAITMLRFSRRSTTAVIGLSLLILVAAASLLATTRQDLTALSFYSAHRLARHPSYDDLLATGDLSNQEIYYREFPAGTVRALRQPSGQLLLMVDGKIEGTAAADVPNTLLLAYLPIASHRDPSSFLNIGLGAGVTAEAAGKLIEDVDIVEINPGVVEVVERYGPPGLLQDRDVAVTDARNFLMRTQRQWDVISSEPSYPTEAGVANLFTLEFYHLAADRLKPDGVYCQWLPYHIMTDDDVTMMVKTFASVFEHTFVWKVPQSLDLILVGSKTRFPWTAEEIQQRVDSMHAGFDGEAELEYVLSRTPDQVRKIALLEDVPLNTDDHPRLEFRVIENLLLGDLALRENP